MSTMLTGMRALITGGSAGLGAAVAKILANRGAKVAINYSSNRDRALTTLKGLQGEGHVLIQGNVFDEKDIVRVVQEAIGELGGIDIVISNAGWTKFGAFNDLNSVSSNDWTRCYQSNVLSHLWIMRACQNELDKNNGVMVISASVAGLQPSGSSMAYAVSKAATIHLAKSLAVACAPNIRVNAVAAGVMLTEWSEGFTDEYIAKVKQSNALKKVTEVEDVAGVYVSLVENKSTTGQCIEVSSGFRM